MTEKPFLSVIEAAKFLGVSADYIYREANKPGFPAYRPVPRGKIFIDRQKLINWASSGR